MKWSDYVPHYVSLCPTWVLEIHILLGFCGEWGDCWKTPWKTPAKPKASEVETVESVETVEVKCFQGTFKVLLFNKKWRSVGLSIPFTFP